MHEIVGLGPMNPFWLFARENVLVSAMSLSFSFSMKVSHGTFNEDIGYVHNHFRSVKINRNSQTIIAS